MEISDSDILAADEVEVNCEIINAVRVNIRSQGRTLHSIKVQNVGSGYELMEQLLKYREGLDEVKKIPTRDN